MYLDEEPEIEVFRRPSYVGGDQALFCYFKKNLNIPDSCTIESGTTILQIQLLIDTAGVVSNVELLKSEFIADQCKEQIAKIFYSMPKWNPGISNGRFANRFITLPIRIELNEQ